MATERVEYRFVLDAYTPETIPMARLAEYMADLAVLYGEQSAVHFVRVESSSTAVVSAIEEEADTRVAERLVAVQLDENAPPEARQARESIARRAREDGGKAPYIASGAARILTFPTGEAVEAEPTYGPFWQSGNLTGSVYRAGGKGKIVSMKLEDRSTGTSYLCRAKRSVAKRLLEHMWGPAVRVSGRGQWLREANGQWRLIRFEIQDFSPLDHESLTETITRLRAIGGAWKDRPDPLAELDANKSGNEVH